VLEPFQTRATLDGQVLELSNVLAGEGTPPLTLIGFSYGAILSYLCAARYPALVSKLILVGCPPFEEQYASRITETRLGRLSPEQQIQVQYLESQLSGPATQNKQEILSQLGALMARADTFNSIQADDEMLHCQYDIYQTVWEEVRKLRQSGTLLQIGNKITCPVIAIHGDYDPHPMGGVREPLSRVIRYFLCIALKNCGHRPWIEREAGDAFYSALMREI
jgi:pimeloyl-ACP methyl ester carboxylesterase